ncbi:MAG TPA: coenzyme F420-0:L-glutamate ligase [Solirubrobacteraceae bacterium]|nr:coenzyme F420-0:L-glutamate ligase [Solirubrobacteraceae bacterium]
MTDLRARPLHGIPEIAPGDDLAAELTAAAARAGGLEPGDVLVVAHKVVSKAEGAIVDLATVTPTARARFIAQEHGKDPRAVQVVLDQTAEIVRVGPGVIICRTPHGFVCANAGVDASNAGAPDRLVTLPRDPDASARALRAAIPGRPAVVISDSFGRAWRHGQTEAAIGVAGLRPLEDWRGRPDAEGRELRATWIAVADQAAGAADLVRGKDARVPAVLLRGLARLVTGADGPGARALLRPREEDLFA